MQTQLIITGTKTKKCSPLIIKATFRLMVQWFQRLQNCKMDDENIYDRCKIMTIVQHGTPNDPKNEWTRSPAHKILISVQIVNFTENFCNPVSKVLIPLPKRLAFKDLKMVKIKILRGPCIAAILNFIPD